MNADVSNKGNLFLLSPGTLLKQRYRIIRTIGEGGFGITYEGSDQVLNLRVCIKEFYLNGYVARDVSHSNEVSSLASDKYRQFFERERAKFLKEARILAKCADDPHVVTVRDYFEENNTAYIVMEYLEGMTLSGFLKLKGRLTERETMDLLGPVMDSLTRLHEMGLIHRDLGPDNLILAGGTVKIIDFGASAPWAASTDQELSVIVKGGYSPVEQYRHDGSQGPWTDVYALAATIYRCLTGRKPDSALDRLIHDTLKRPSELGIEVNPDFEQAVMKELSMDYHDRWQSMAAFHRALTGYGVRNSVNKKADAASFAPATQDGSEETSEETVSAGQGEDIDDEATHFGGSTMTHLQTVMPDRNEEEASWAENTMAAPVQENDEESAPALASGSRNTEDETFSEDKTPSARKPRSEKKIINGKKISRQSRPKAERRTRRKSHAQRDHAKRGIFSLRNLIIIAAGLVAAVAIAVGIVENNLPVVLFEGTINATEIGQEDRIAVIVNRTIGKGELKKLRRLHSLQEISFEKCTFEEGAEKELRFMPGSVRMLTVNSCKGITNLPDFGSLRGIQILTLAEDGITDQMLAGANIGSIRDLQQFSIIGNPEVTNLDFLKGTETSLKGLWISGTGVSDLSQVSDFRNLTLLSAKDDGIRDLAPGGSLTSLKYLYVSHNELKTDAFAAIADLPDLEILYASDNEIEDLTSFAGMSNLKTLAVNHNKISDLTPLSGLSKLSNLYAMYNSITDISPLASVESLRGLFISGNRIGSLEASKFLGDLSQLRAADCGLADLDGLQYLDRLNLVVLDDNQLSDLSALEKSKDSLNYLSANNNQLTSLEFLKGAQKLSLVCADGNRLTSAEFLAQLPGLSFVSLENNEIASVPEFTGSSTFKGAFFGNNRIASFSLAKIQHLYGAEISLNHNQLQKLDAAVVDEETGEYRNPDSIFAIDNPIRDIGQIDPERLDHTGILYMNLWIDYQDGMDVENLGRIRGIHMAGVPDDVKFELHGKGKDLSSLSISDEDADKEAEKEKERILNSYASILQKGNETKENTEGSELWQADDEEEKIGVFF